LRKLGFRNFQVLDHRRVTKLDSEVSVYCYRVGTLDSCLDAIAQGQTVFDVNDARLNQADYSRILNDIGPVDVVLNQFSIAVKESVVDYERHARAAGRDVLESISADHQGLRAKVTVPFASFMYFSCIDNANMNAFSNKPREVFRILQGQRAGSRSALSRRRVRRESATRLLCRAHAVR